MKVYPIPSLTSLQLSPASYQPECLHEFVKLAVPQCDSHCFTSLLCQLNHFDSWVTQQEYHQLCMNHLASSDNMKDLVKFAQARVMAGDTEAAIKALELGKRDSWPEIYRLI